MRILFSLLLLLALLGAGPAHAAASDGFVAHSTGWSSFVASGNSEPSPAPAVDGHGGETDGHEAAGGDPHETGGHHAEQSRTGIPLVLLAVLLFYSAAALTLGLIRRRQA
jgi:hypothetical protein